MFNQIKVSLDDVKMNGLSFPAIFQLLKLVGQPDQLSFSMPSASMPAAVQMLIREVVQATWQITLSLGLSKKDSAGVTLHS